MRQDAFEQLCRDNPERLPPGGARLHAEAARPRAVLGLLRRPRAAAHRTPSPAPTSTATRTTRGRSGTTSAGCSRPSTAATRRWGSPPTTAGCSPTTPRSTRCASPTKSAATSATWAATTTGRPIRRRPTCPAHDSQRADRRRHPRAHLRAVDHRPGAAPQRAGRSPVAPRQESGAARRPRHRTAPTSPRRKKEGAFYTPAFITRYIVEQALGGVLRDRFERLRQAHAADGQRDGGHGAGRSRRLRPRQR